jgi:ABC-type uncharacterized transport system substrate-binding protein
MIIMFKRNKPIKILPGFLIIAFSGILLSILLIRPVGSHPHVFIETGLVVQLSDEGITGFWQHWAFDEYFSAWVIDDFDTDKDGKFSDEELKHVYEGTFTYIKQHGYFTRVLKSDKEIPVTKIENFSVQIKDNRVIYSFFVPLEIKISQSAQDIIIAVYDESFYCHIFFPPDEVGFDGNPSSWKIEYTTQELPEFSFYFGFLIPAAVKLSITPLCSES